MMQGKTVVITGASDGLGKAAAKVFHDKGAKVVIVGRSPEKTKAVAAELNVPYYICDFAKLADVRKLAQDLQATYPTIDVLINNAGGLFGKRTMTVDGYELTMQVNHLAHFLLTITLLDTLIASRATIINTSSIANKVLSRFAIDDLNLAQHYTAYRAYGNAKLANILFTKELQRRYGAQGISAAAFHPGVVATNFSHDSPGVFKYLYHTPLKRFLHLSTVAEGIDTMVWLATSRAGIDWQPGGYFVKRQPATAHRLADDERVARSLWEQSEAMVAAH